MEQKKRSYESWTSPSYIISLIQIKFLQLLGAVGMQIKQEIGRNTSDVTACHCDL